MGTVFNSFSCDNCNTEDNYAFRRTGAGVGGGADGEGGGKQCELRVM